MASWEIINNDQEWDKALAENLQSSFLQASAFGEFQSNLGQKTWRLGLKSSGNLGSFCQLIKIRDRLGSYFYVPSGPVLTDWGQDLGTLVTYLTELSKNEDVNFIRFDPRSLGQKEQALLEELGFVKSPVYTQPQTSLILDLTKSLEEIKSEFSSTTRYNIGWVERKGVTVKISQSESDIAIFDKLLSETAARHNFRRYRQSSYYKEQYLAFARKNQAKLFLAYEPEEFGQEVLASAVVIYFGTTVTYLHAASSSKSPKLRAPYLMQWRIIEDAKQSGFKEYDFWGIAKDNNPNDPWAGVTEFKTSFGGQRQSYEKPFDLALNQKYYLTIGLERARAVIKKIRS